MLTTPSDATANLKRRLQRLLREPIPTHFFMRKIPLAISRNVVGTLRTQTGLVRNPDAIHGRESQMTRLLKTLGLALGAMATMVAIAAPAANAATGSLTAGEFPAVVTGSQVAGPTFDIGEGPLKVVGCATADLNSTLAGPTDPVTLTPIYGECVSEPGAMPVTVTLNGCDYSFGISQPGTTEQPATTGKLESSILCPEGQRIEIDVFENAAAHAANMPLCVYDIAAQGPVPGGIYHNVAGNPGDVLATVKARFTAKRTGLEMVCGGGGILQHLPVTLTGSYTLKAFHEFAGGGEGAQVALHGGPLD